MRRLVLAVAFSWSSLFSASAGAEPIVCGDNSAQRADMRFSDADTCCIVRAPILFDVCLPSKLLETEEELEERLFERSKNWTLLNLAAALDFLASMDPRSASALSMAQWQSKGFAVPIWTAHSMHAGISSQPAADRYMGNGRPEAPPPKIRLDKVFLLKLVLGAIATWVAARTVILLIERWG